MVEAVKEELEKAAERAREQQNAIMKSTDCEFVFAIETETDASGKVTIWALELDGGVKLTESNTVTNKYGPLGKKIMPAND